MAAQTVHEVPSSQPGFKPVTAAERPVPFSLAGDAKQEQISYLTADQMTEKDRNLVADAESSISERARFVGLEFNGGKWSYEQVVCPALPNHILLRFTRKAGTGYASIFSASIPRNGEGRVRIIPIRLRGYSLFSPAPVNALTISAFNHIRAEEHAEEPANWLGTGLCYAALAGGHPKAALMANAPDATESGLAAPATVETTNQGKAIISFVDVSAHPKPMEWTMFFDSKGKLLKATHVPAQLATAKTIRP